MRRVLLGLFLMWFGCEASAYPSSKPYPLIVSSPNGRYCYKQLPLEKHVRNGAAGTIRVASGIAFRIEDNGELTELWRDETGYSSTVFLDNDGRHAVKLWPYAPPAALPGEEFRECGPVLRFFCEGTMIREYRATELEPEERLPGWGGRWWTDSPMLEANSSFGEDTPGAFDITTTAGTQYRFSMDEGKILHRSARPSAECLRRAAIGNLHALLTKHLRSSHAGKVLLGPFPIISENDAMEATDLVVYRRGHLPELTADEAKGSPDLAIHVVEPARRKTELKVRTRQCLQFKIPELWFVDPVARTIEVFRCSESPDKPAATYSVTDTFTSPLLPGLEIRSADIFADLPTASR